MIWQFEMTDTFGGEANYSWVRRAYATNVETEGDALKLALAWAGWDPSDVESSGVGDCLEVRPNGQSVVLFLFTDEGETGRGNCVNETTGDER